MAESQNIAFGRYLRTLRKRRSLSLQDVASLSQAFAETLNKGYLSRCENGRQRRPLDVLHETEQKKDEKNSRGGNTHGSPAGGLLMLHATDYPTSPACGHAGKKPKLSNENRRTRTAYNFLTNVLRLSDQEEPA